MKNAKQKADELKNVLLMIVNKRLHHSIMLCDIFVLAPSGSRRGFVFMYSNHVFAKYIDGKMNINKFAPALWGKDKYVFDMFNDIVEHIGMNIVYDGKKPVSKGNPVKRVASKKTVSKKKVTTKNK
jgi:hypothetical protein